MYKSPYCSPVSKGELQLTETNLTGANGEHYPFLKSVNVVNQIPIFVDDSLLVGGDRISKLMYKKDDAELIYENFLTWLFETFNEDEATFRNSLIEKLNLKEGSKVLVTGCGLGDDLIYIMPLVGSTGEVFAQDLSDVMIAATARILNETNVGSFDLKNLYLSVSNAAELPFPDAYFDAAYHFGGINLFSDIGSAINEMARVVKVGGKVLFGDEGVAPWLKEIEYGKIAINNNQLWALAPPLSSLPENASNVNLTWVLGNCFYVVDFEVAASLPFMNIDVPHKGIRGGNMRKRYFGQLEGIDPSLKEAVRLAATDAGISSSALLEQLISKGLTDLSTIKG